MVTHLDDDHGEYPGVYEVLDAVADGVDGVEAGVGGGGGAGLVRGEDHAPRGDAELQVGQRGARPQPPRQTHLQQHSQHSETA